MTTVHRRFAVPYTDLFTLEGWVQEIDSNSGGEYADSSNPSAASAIEKARAPAPT